MVENGQGEGKPNRLSASVDNLSQRFYFSEQNRNFTTQYCNIYTSRLVAMRDSLLQAAKRAWGNDINYCKLMELKTGITSCIIGTLFKRMSARPNILQEISDEYNLIPLPPRTKYADDSDELVAEDETQRISLTGNINVTKSVTGVIVALLGKELDGGKFYVNEMVSAGLPKQIPRPFIHNDKYICIVSGLNLGSSHQGFLTMQLFIDFITGRLTEGQEDRKMCSQIVQIVIAGNSAAQQNSSTSETNKANSKKFSSRSSANTLEGIKALDEILTQLCSCIPVDIMPGEFDPSNHIMPQQPLHPCMFPKGFQFSSLKSVTNPYEFSVDGVRFLGTSGQNIDDIYRYSYFEDRLEICEQCLRWGHISPTAPDTLACYPYYEKDPFILESCPHVYFVGNQPEFSCKKITGDQEQEVLLVNVPSFNQKHSCVLVNTRTLDCKPISFDLYENL
ncbi:DNA polymerase delta subunit 2 [Trichoplax sp. H2]|uniref:DNA polymerase delta subunit 2 n=1 Tax=Trichoplax adhaerens TaxID=10228 RepID=B3RMY7_TRIAD|nr:hypothetical protein TRIADDRAFT_52972 [Trichoplax adhaerens]EDV27358.1 hypothetical protein TRIADDRAFT_52972 [Trichoplax adhaerens]RDD39872.1 DNA polymerase delta subunit 2 [Trichoplax sp. H2]|eukprot:XP_002109192.1 hypothetical protein TRIADDRAFT_52972 [Trichoplax adhaerens]